VVGIETGGGVSPPIVFGCTKTGRGLINLIFVVDCSTLLTVGLSMGDLSYDLGGGCAAMALSPPPNAPNDGGDSYPTSLLLFSSSSPPLVSGKAPKSVGKAPKPAVSNPSLLPLGVELNPKAASAFPTSTVSAVAEPNGATSNAASIIVSFALGGCSSSSSSLLLLTSSDKTLPSLLTDPTERFDW